MWTHSTAPRATHTRTRRCSTGSPPSRTVVPHCCRHSGSSPTLPPSARRSTRRGISRPRRRCRAPGRRRRRGRRAHGARRGSTPRSRHGGAARSCRHEPALTERARLLPGVLGYSQAAFRTGIIGQCGWAVIEWSIDGRRGVIASRYRVGPPNSGDTTDGYRSPARRACRSVRPACDPTRRWQREASSSGRRAIRRRRLGTALRRRPWW
jgi:hypothetical protein